MKIMGIFDGEGYYLDEIRLICGLDANNVTYGIVICKK